MSRILKFWEWPSIAQAIFYYLILSISISTVIFIWVDLNKLKSAEDKIKFAQAIVTTWGGLAVGFNLYLAGRRTDASIQNAEAANRNAKATEEGQITERFTQAVEQLGNNENIAIRIGGIYTLERIAQNSSQDHWRIMETLSAFVREKAPFSNNQESNTDDQDSENEQFKPPKTDIQAALTVIGRRIDNQDPPKKCIDLSNADLRGSDCSGGYFHDAIFEGSHFKMASFLDTKLQRTNLGYARLQCANFDIGHLQGANLFCARLQNARFLSAHLEGAHFVCAWLQGASFANAHLEGASLEGSNLEGADLKGAYLQGANLRAKNIIQQQIEYAFGDESTVLPEHLERPEHWKSRKQNNASDEETEQQN